MGELYLRGKWIPIDECLTRKCSVCGSCVKAADHEEYMLSNLHFCPVCGSIMHGKHMQNELSLGLKMWYANKELDEVCGCKVIKIEYNHYTFPYTWITIEYTSQIVGTHEYKNRIDLIFEKILFFSQEEAQHALSLIK